MKTNKAYRVMTSNELKKCAKAETKAINTNPTYLMRKLNKFAQAHQLYEKEFGEDAMFTERTTKQGTYSAEIYERCETEEPFCYTKVRVSQRETDKILDDGNNIYDALFA